MAHYSPGQNQGTSGSNPVQDPAPPADVSYKTECSHEKPPSPPAPANGSNKLMWCGIVVLVAILVGGGVGIAFALTGNDAETTERVVGPITEDSKDPPPVATPPSELVATMVPTLSQTRPSTMEPTETPTEETICPEEYEGYNSCLQSLSGFDSSFCGNCIHDIFQVLVEGESCSDYTDTYCSTIESCNCQGCEDTFRVWVNCALQDFSPSDCLGECKTTPPTPAPAEVTLAPTEPVDPCQAEYDQYQSCFGYLTDEQSDECVACANDVLSTTSRSSCSEYTADLCNGLSTCTSCGFCRDDLLAWADCAIDGDQCEVDCSTVTTDPPVPPDTEPPVDPPTEAPASFTEEETPVTLAPTEPVDSCQAEYDQYQSCFGFLTDEQIDECVTCANDVLSTTSRSSCPEYTAGLCNGFLACTSCGSCEDELLAWADCQIDRAQCEMDCSTVTTDPPVPPTTEPPVDPPTEAPTSFTEEETPVSTFAPDPVEDTKAPSQAPVSRPTPAPEARVCDFEETSYQQCLNVRLSNAEADACVTCTNQALQGLGGTQCTNLHSAFCSSFSACSSCGSCANLIVGWVDCQVAGPDCDLECDVDFTAPPTPVPELTKCETELDQYATCLVTNVASQDNRLACISCVNDASSNAPLDSCSSFEGSFCISLSQCTTCDVCAERAISYIDCVVSDSQCQLDCSTDSEPPACTSEESAYQSCLPGLGSFRAQGCVDCYNTALDDTEASSCTEFNSQFCSAFSNCDCGSCDDEMIDWLDCRFTPCSVSC